MTTDITVMRNRSTAVARADPIPTAREHEHELKAWSTGCSIMRPLPVHVLDAARAELIAALAAPPAAEDEVQRIVAALVGAYPQRAAMPELYVASLADTASEFPRNVIAEAARWVRDNVKFLPTCADFRDACARIQATRQLMLKGVEKHQAEHQRRGTLPPR